MDYLKQRGAVLLQFGLCMLVGPMRPRALTYYQIARRDFMLERVDAMEWALYTFPVDEEHVEDFVQKNFIQMMNRAWGNEDDPEWLARLR